MLALAAKETSHGSALPRQAWEVMRRLVDDDMGSLVYDFLDVTKVCFFRSNDRKDHAVEPVVELP